MLTMIIGTAASGKSRYAEEWCSSLPGDKIYIATMEPCDEECRERIARHHAMRAGRGFTTVECYRDIGRLEIPSGSNVLLECMSNLLANEMYAPSGEKKPEEAADQIWNGIQRLHSSCLHLSVVTNEVFLGGTDYEGDMIPYLKALAEINRRLASESDQVVQVVCGIPKYRRRLK